MTDHPSALQEAALANTRPGRRERVAAIGVLALSVLAVVVIAPIARISLGRIDAFIPGYEAALVIVDLITGVLLFGHFLRVYSAPLLILASAYLFESLIIVPHLLAFPGVFSPGGLLGAGPQTSAWLYIFWHGGFALYVIAYAITTRLHPQLRLKGSPLVGMAWAVVIAIVAVLGLATLSIAGQAWLFPIIRGTDYSVLVRSGISPAMCLMGAAPLVLLWPRRNQSTLDLWLMIVMVAWLGDVVLSSVVGSNRFDLGWYSGRTFGILAASFLLVTLLAELNGVQSRLTRRSAELQVNEARLRSIFETTHLYQALLSRDGAVVYANSTSLQGIQAALETVADKPFWETPWFAATPEVAERVRDAVVAVAAGEIVRTEMQLSLPIGERWFDFTMRPIVNERGEVVAMVPEAADITERRQAEDSLRQSQKMEAIGQLTGGVAHDFNNLLTGIMGSLEMLQTRLGQGRTGDLDRYISTALQAATRAASLTHRLLAFSRRQTLDPGPTHLNQLVAGMEDLIRRTVGPRIDTQVMTEPDLWLTLVDRNQLESALLNLCINARDAMPSGGRLTIETNNVHLGDASAAANELETGDYVALRVSDTGTGMPREVIARAFDPFFTTKPLGMGTGLGLSMVYGFAQQSGGQVRITSQVDEGTTVCIFLPRHHGVDERADTARRAAAAAAPTGNGVILVVDDEPSVRDWLTEVLSDQGYQLLQADDANAGLKILQSPVPIDLLISDVGLPGGMNGRQLADTARLHRPDLPVLFITGYAENVLVGGGALEPGMQVLTKPFTTESLMERIVASLGST